MFKNIFTKKKLSKFNISCFETNQEELDQCITGDNVNLWYSEKEDSVRIYRLDTEYGKGLIGTIRGSKSKKIKNHLTSDDLVEARIEQVRKGAILIDCTIISGAELKAKKETEIKTIRDEITKPFAPKVLSYTLYSKDKIDIQNGDQVEYESKDLIIDLNDSKKIEYHRIKLFKSKIYLGDISAQSIVRKLVQAYLSGFLPIIKATKVEENNKNLKIRLNINFENRPVPNN